MMPLKHRLNPRTPLPPTMKARGIEYRTLTLEGDWEAQLARMRPDASIEGLSLYSLHGSHANRSIDFLRDWPFLKRLSIATNTLIDLAGMRYVVDTLEHLSLTGSWKPRLDLAMFRAIEFLQIRESKDLIGLRDCASLRYLYLDDHSPADQSFSELSHLQNLETLSLDKARLTSTRGIDEMSALDELWLSNCKIMASFQREQPNTWMRRLVIEKCPALVDVSGIALTRDLQWLAIGDCVSLKSYASIAGLQKLHRLVIVGKCDLSDDEYHAMVAMPSITTLHIACRTHKHLRYPDGEGA